MRLCCLSHPFLFWHPNTISNRGGACRTPQGYTHPIIVLVLLFSSAQLNLPAAKFREIFFTPTFDKFKVGWLLRTARVVSCVSYHAVLNMTRRPLVGIWAPVPPTRWLLQSLSQPPSTCSGTQGQIVRGTQVYVTDPDQFDPIDAALNWMAQVKRIAGPGVSCFPSWTHLCVSVRPHVLPRMAPYPHVSPLHPSCPKGLRLAQRQLDRPAHRKHDRSAGD